MLNKINVMTFGHTASKAKLNSCCSSLLENCLESALFQFQSHDKDSPKPAHYFPGSFGWSNQSRMSCHSMRSLPLIWDTESIVMSFTRDLLKSVQDLDNREAWVNIRLIITSSMWCLTQRDNNPHLRQLQTAIPITYALFLFLLWRQIID